MITGYNTDVKHNGQVFHVQTEDKGRANPTIESLIYAGGKILASRQYSYAWLLKEGYNEKTVQQLLDAQHRKMMRDIHGGKYDPSGPPAFGAGIITNRGFDELVLEFLKSQEGSGGLEIVVTEPPPMAPGELVVLEIIVRRAATGSPEKSAVVVIRAAMPVDSTGGARSVILHQGVADADGKLKAGVEIPRDAVGGMLVIEAAAKGAAAEAAFRVVAR